LFEAISRTFKRRALKDETYAFLFDPPPPDEWVSLDFETTGLNPKTAEIISVGAVLIKGKTVLTSQKFSMLVKPEKTMDRKSITIHQLRYSDLADARTADEAVRALLLFIGSRPIVGYYIAFDTAILNRYAKALIGCALPNRTIEVSGLYYDKKEARIPQGHIDLRFDTIRKELGIPSFGKHSALGDAVMTALIFIKLTTPGFSLRH
jgi:DNA polymerase-3 subunit epsilon